MLTRRGFVRAGALLEGEDRERLKAITQRLAVLGTEFTQNLLADERGWSMPLGPDDLAPLPDFLQDAARSAGRDRDADGPIVTLSRSLIVPFLQFSPNRALRKKAWEAWSRRGESGGKTDNRAIVTETLALRKERAALLGYKTFADFKLDVEMAKTPDAVEDLLMQVWTPARSAAMADAKVLTKMLHDDGEAGQLEPWDWRYYAEKRRAAEHDLNEAELKPYFQLDRMIDAAFALRQPAFRAGGQARRRRASRPRRPRVGNHAGTANTSPSSSATTSPGARNAPAPGAARPANKARSGASPVPSS